MIDNKQMFGAALTDTDTDTGITLQRKSLCIEVSYDQYTLHLLLMLLMWVPEAVAYSQ